MHPISPRFECFQASGSCYFSCYFTLSIQSPSFVTISILTWVLKLSQRTTTIPWLRHHAHRLGTEPHPCSAPQQGCRWRRDGRTQQVLPSFRRRTPCVDWWGPGGLEGFLLLRASCAQAVDGKRQRMHYRVLHTWQPRGTDERVYGC